VEINFTHFAYKQTVIGDQLSSVSAPHQAPP